ncbi:MAG TPA: hypothetical protein VGP82_17750 [Ktedonobacterales bacterium]|jgi:hypothetical protein|nr:hypothetical protein [Ktedonobacterales bacterium]
MLKDAERSGRDMTGALVQLVNDQETRRILSHAYASIGAPVSAPVVEAIATTIATPGQSDDRPPTGPGSPTAHASGSKRRGAGTERPAVIRLQPARPAAAERIRVYPETHPRASSRTIERSCAVSRATASKHRALWLQEREHAQAEQLAQ